MSTDDERPGATPDNVETSGGGLSGGGPASGLPDEPFVVGARSEGDPEPLASGGDGGDDAVLAGGTRMDAAQRRWMLEQRIANPGDPPVARLPPGGGPSDLGAPGRTAIVQGQVYLVGVILVVQLWLVTTALFELLSGRPRSLWGITIASAIGFAIALVIVFWPRRRVRGR